MSRCGKCQNCLELEKIQQRVLACANPPFSHADNGVTELWNKELERLPCLGLLNGHKPNFNTLVLAAKNGDLALLDCRDKKTGEPVPVVAAVFKDEGGMYNMVPLAKMFADNPYEEVDPPNPDGGYWNG